MAGADAPGPTADQLALVSSRHLGGVLLTGRSSAGTTATRRITDDLRSRSGGAVTGGVGLWVATDQEGGNVQVLSGPGFSTIPTALSQGALPPATLRDRAAGWGRELAAAGVDLDLAPVLDTVPADLGTRNQPIGLYAREYAHDPAAVSASGGAFAAGMRDAGVQATAKHFPGLGRVIGNTDTTADVVDSTTVRGDAYLQPFADAVRAGIPAVMVSSAVYSRIDGSTIAAFSPVVVQQLLRGDLGFRGVVVSDSLGAAALAPTPVADRAADFIAAGGTVALSAQSGIVAPMVDGVLARARSSAAFHDQVVAAAQVVVRTKLDAGLVTCPQAAGAIADRYAALGGAGSVLGFPVGAEFDVPGGSEQRYQNGAIYWSPATGAHEVHGFIGRHYDELGGPAGPLGFPVTDELGTPDGVGRYNHFAGTGGSSIYFTPATGARDVLGAIRVRWAAQGWERGPLGYPVSDEYGIAGGRRESDFQHGSLVWPFTS
jgi:beta-N-acetylhexosaminidase